MEPTEQKPYRIVDGRVFAMSRVSGQEVRVACPCGAINRCLEREAVAAYVTGKRLEFPCPKCGRALSAWRGPGRAARRKQASRRFKNKLDAQRRKALRRAAAEGAPWGLGATSPEPE